MLNLVGGLDQPTAGSIRVGNIEVAGLSPRELTQYRRKTVGHIFQNLNLIPTLTAAENVELPMLIAGIPKKERLERATDLLEKVDLLHRKDHKPDELSGGERQRVAIARFLANQPTILLADEPTGDLDTESGQAVLNLLKEVNETENQTVIMVTHDANIAKQANRIFHIKDGIFISLLQRKPFHL